jgi:site-specific DNA-methyltransferase (adenine-specific)
MPSTATEMLFIWKSSRKRGRHVSIIMNADCLDVLKNMADKSVGIVITDPPYGLNIAKAGKIGKGRSFTIKDWDSEIPDQRYFNEIYRVSKRQIIWGGNYFAHCLPATQCWLVWWKQDGLPRGTFADCELAWTSFKKPAQVFNSRWHGFIRDSREPRCAHPTQKALEVMKWCVREFTDPDDTVLDPFLGSGTTCIAARELGRQFIGIEKDKEYCAIAEERVARLI